MASRVPRARARPRSPGSWRCSTPARGHREHRRPGRDGHAVRGPGDLRGAVAMLFQSPRASTDPRLTLRSIIAQPAEVARRPVDVEGSRRAWASPGPAHAPAVPGLRRAAPAGLPGPGAGAGAALPDLRRGDRDARRCDHRDARAPGRGRGRRAGRGVLLISHDEELLAACCSQVNALEDLRRASAPR
ncbi:hypothetical protein NKG05_08150 [Oerskovia sp. M15]